MRKQLENKIEKLTARIEKLVKQYGENSAAVYRHGDKLQDLIEELEQINKWGKNKKESEA